jgi:HB1, ASXL, restriction endonuclease HTH domain
MTQRKSKTATSKTSAQASNGKAADADTPVKPPKQARGKMAPTTSPAEVPASATEAPSAPPAKEKAKSGKLSALDAAAKVLAETGQAMTCQEMIDAMATQGYWSSPGGRTPAATLYSAILRELKSKGDACRFVKTGRGKFVRQ